MTIAGCVVPLLSEYWQASLGWHPQREVGSEPIKTLYELERISHSSSVEPAHQSISPLIGPLKTHCQTVVLFENSFIDSELDMSQDYSSAWSIEVLISQLPVILDIYQGDHNEVHHVFTSWQDLE